MVVEMQSEKLITDEMVSDALSWLSTSVADEASARAARERFDFQRKQTQANNFLSAGHLPNVAAREAWAITQPNYITCCEKFIEAVERDEYYRNKRNACAVIIEAWRTQNANERAASSFR